MNAYLWQSRDDVAHLVRATSPEEVRERIAATHGLELAKRAVIKRVGGRGEGDSAAA